MDIRLALKNIFGQEWDDLASSDQDLIVRDCTEEDGVQDLAEYHQNIGVGNLFEYARVMRVRFRKTDARK